MDRQFLKNKLFSKNHQTSAADRSAALLGSHKRIFVRLRHRTDLYRTHEDTLRPRTELLLLPRRPRLLSDRLPAGSPRQPELSVFLLCRRISDAVRLGFRSLHLRMALSVRFGTGSALPDPDPGSL